MRVLGIDPGYDRLGIAVVEKTAGQNKETLVYSSCFTTSPKDSFYTRLVAVGAEISRIIDEYKPESLSIESLYVTNNQKTAMRVAEARGVIVYEAVRRGLPVYEYTPGQIKIAVTGHGASDKEQVMKMIPLLLKIPNKKAETLDDEYDAIAVALTCLASAGHIRSQK
ncbi:MAG: crossover junction endodeoxyribonuclease RuvC, crossover junction endodeoxyribonuclease RuvC [Candidatus Parcubacteria bacterium]|jgi:crossover junction endodeoxyribonuclease RuvC